jgi:predicted AAA+ superfamily ATPase
MDRRYETLLSRHLSTSRESAIICGPRNVGKSTSACAGSTRPDILSWDRPDDRRMLLSGAAAVASHLSSDTPAAFTRHLVLHEIHKHRGWQKLFAEILDTCGEHVRSTVTASAAVGSSIGNESSLWEHCLAVRMHPLSVAEVTNTRIDVRGPSRPAQIARGGFADLERFGGFPEPYLKSSPRFSNRWRKNRWERLFHEDLRDLTQIQETGQVEVLGKLLAEQVGELLNYSILGRNVSASVDTVRRWIEELESLFYCFTVRPWSKSVPKSLLKQPKAYLWDWSGISDRRTRRENLVASHLLKAVHWWTDVGLGAFELCYLRDKAKRGVSFVVIRDGEPWFLVDIESSKPSSTPGISNSLRYYYATLQPAHAFQLSFAMDFVERDCFLENDPVRVPAETLLSQLV